MLHCDSYWELSRANQLRSWISQLDASRLAPGGVSKPFWPRKGTSAGVRLTTQFIDRGIRHAILPNKEGVSPQAWPTTLRQNTTCSLNGHR
ncbi:hypothetical protein PoB_005116100 [Plakobranchus ocellatus]|uniref:Uncharacterized protein n=1 Tax=Plakobranchus ocellatus TaxID=259542 RepID=A0AAV4BN01_9GAST|nr:hypothetical protein PoB_005116100 [Plakobranchus ocellatus]